MTRYPMARHSLQHQKLYARYYRPLGFVLLLFFGAITSSNATYSPIVGCASGTAFTDPAPANQRLTSLKLRTSTWIDALQGITANGSLPNRGGTGGTEINVTWPSNEYLVRIYGSYNSAYVGQISLVTNTGRVLGPYGAPKYPTKKVITGYYLFFFPIYSTVPDYSTFDYSVPAGQMMVGFLGRASHLVNALGVIYGSIVPSTAVKCANENGTCALPAGATATIYYGANGKFFLKSGLTGNVACNNTTFGDPVSGVGKTCAYALTGTAATANDNLIVNGSFEVATGYYPTINGWKGLNDTLEINTPASYGVSGATGNQVVELDANIGGSPTGFYQDITTQANQTYVLSADIGLRAGTPLATNSVEVWWRNQLIATVEPSATALTNYKLNVVGSGGADRLEFREQAGDDNGLGGIIDNVKLIKATATNPTPPPTASPAPDLTVSLAQPAPALKATAMSEVELTVSNKGTGAAAAPINVSLNLPTNISAPLKFTRGAEHWVCKTTNQLVSCSFDLSIAQGANSIVRIPVTPAANTLGTTPTPFAASVAVALGETVLNNNGPFNMSPTTAVAALNLSVLPDPLGIYSRSLLDATTIAKYVLPMPNLLAPVYKHIPNTVAGADSYTLDIQKVKAQVLPPGFPATDVFAYGDPARPDSFSYPAHTIEARSTNAAVNTRGLGKPTKVQYKNTSSATEHVLDSIDPTIGTSSIVDRSITGAKSISKTNLREEIRTVTHLHGAKRINQQSNGHPESWSSPAGQTGVAAGANNRTVPFNASPFDYSNDQEAALLWYHDLTLGLARLNVYAGLAGLYVVRDDNESTMITNNQLPSGAYEVPLILQDRMFRADGSFAYPDIDVGGAPSPSWVKEFYGDVMVVNGVAWPYFQVEPRKYRLRVLNASNLRTYKLALENSANTTATLNFQVIGTDGGFLNAPVTTNNLIVAPGERYDIIVDFAALNGANITLKNSAGTSFASSSVTGGEVAPVAGLHDQLMQFRVNIPLSNTANSTTPTSLRAPIVDLVPSFTNARTVSISELIDFDTNRVQLLLGTAIQGPKLWTDLATETATNGTVETWEIYNNTPNTHAIHLHAGQFQIVDRQAFNAFLDVNGELTNITFPSAAVPASALEKGWKDTVIAYPSPTNNPGTVDGQTANGMVTRIRMKFENVGDFLWHSSMLEYMDNEMQRPLIVQ